MSQGAVFAGRFAVLVGDQPESVASADFDGDGLADLAVANRGGDGMTVLYGLPGGGFGGRVDLPIGPGYRGLVAGDLNGDGRPDLAATDGQVVAVLYGQSGGGFGGRQDVQAGTWPEWIAVADFDVDGRPDLAVVNASDGTVSFLYGQPGGGFGGRQDIAVGAWPETAAAADFNGDGRCDLAVANIAGSTLSILYGQSGGGFQRQDVPAGNGPSGLAAADFDGDGRTDLAVTNWYADSLSVFYGQAGGGLGGRVDMAVGEGPDGLVAADLSGDGLTDLAVANFYDGTVTILYGQPGGGFGQRRDVAVGDGPQGIVAADFNNDGRPDLAITNANEDTLTILEGQPDGGPGERRDVAVGDAPFGTASADFNGDGRLDLAVANTDGGTVSILYGSPGGGFDDRRDWEVGAGPQGIVCAYLNGDDFPDLAVANRDANTVSILYGQPDGSLAGRLDVDVGVAPYDVAVADFNDDWLADLAVSNAGGSTVTILYGLAGGGFGDRQDLDVGVGQSPRGIVVWDFNADGLGDLAVASNAASSVAVFYGQTGGGLGGRQDLDVGDLPWGLVTADFDGDGLPDLAAANYGMGTVTIHYGQAGGGFGRRQDVYVGPGPQELAAADLDGDGRADLAAATLSRIVVLYSGDAGLFDAVEWVDPGGQPASVAAFDYDGDGRKDLLAARLPGWESLLFLLNLGSEGPGVNDPPSFVGGWDQVANEDCGPQMIAGWARNISPGPADESWQTVTFLVENDNAALFAVQPAVAPDGTLTFQPAANANGSAAVTVRARDDGGTESGGGDTSPPRTFIITILPVNDAPTAASQDVVIGPGGSVEITLAISDVETPLASLLLTVTAAPAHGRLVHLGGLRFRYEVGDTYVGSDSFRFTVTDDGDPAASHGSPGDLTSSLATVSISGGQVLPLDATGAATFLDANGDPVTVRLKGGGGSLFFAVAGQPTITRVFLSGTSESSSLTISTKGAAPGVVIGGIDTGNMPLGSIVCPTTWLTGQVRIGPSAKANAGVSMTFDRIFDASIDSGMPIKALTASEWLDGDDQDSSGGRITAPWIGSINIRGVKADPKAVPPTPARPGDLQADLVLTGAYGRNTLGTVKIAGDLTGGNWTVNGPAGQVTVAGKVNGWQFDVRNGIFGSSAVGRLAGLTLGDVQNAVVTVADVLGTVKAIRWTGGRIDADSLGALSIAGVKATKTLPAVLGDFGADVKLRGKNVTGSKPTLGSAVIAGRLTGGTWAVAGTVAKLSIAQVVADVHLPAVRAFACGGWLIREIIGGQPAGLYAVQPDGQAWRITFTSLAKWPKTIADCTGDVGSPASGVPDAQVLLSMVQAGLKSQFAASGLGTWTGDPAKLKPGLLASFGKTDDPTYKFVKGVAYIYDNALAIEALLMGDDPDAESTARAFQIADAFVLLQDRDPLNAGAQPDGQFADLTPGLLRDGYAFGAVAASRTAAKVTVKSVGADDRSSGNQAYAAMALLRAAAVARQRGDAARAADYRRTAGELLLYVGRNRARSGPHEGFRMSDRADFVAMDIGSCEHNIDLARAFEQAAGIEQDAALKALWEAWRDSADHFRTDMYGPNARFGNLAWVSDDWQYLHAGTIENDQVNQDLIPIDTGAWSGLARGDWRDAGFDMLMFLAASTDAGGRMYVGFDPGLRAVADEGLTSRRDGVGTESTAYMALIARAMGDAAVLAALPAREGLTGDEQAAFDAIASAAAGGGTDHDLADYLIAQLAQVQLNAPNSNALGLVAAPVRNVGTGEYSLVNGWSLAATCWTAFAYNAWNPLMDAGM